MKNCETCKFWTREEKAHGAEIPVGRCDLLTDYVATLDDGEARWNNDFITQEDFGCVKHKDVLPSN